MTLHSFLFRLLGTSALAGSALLAPSIAQAQETPPETTSTPAPATQPQATVPDSSLDEVYEGDGQDIIVTGARLPGSVVGDIPPENILDARDIRATGAVDINEVLEALAPQIGSARGRGGERPVLLLNGQRISSFRELRDIPTEAIARVEVLPEEVALKYGYRADQRVVNFVLRPRFRSTVGRVEAGTATDGGYYAGEAEATRLIINRNGRTTLNLRAEGNSALTEAERDVTFRGDPGDPDDRFAQTLVGTRRLVRGTGTVNRQLGQVSATLNTELEHSEGRSLLGLSDFALDTLTRDTSNDSVHAGISLNGDRGRWRWSATSNGDVVRGVTESDRADETARDRSRSTRSSADLDLTAHGPLFKLPAGDASATFKTGASTLHLDSTRRNSNSVNSTDLTRSRGDLAVNLDLPVSRRNSDFGTLGNLTLNANAEIEQLSDFGSLTTIGAGVNWSPVQRLNFITSFTREEGAPSIQQLGDPVLETPGTRIFDFTRGETALVNAITGGNPNLDSDRRNVWKVGANWKPLAETDLRLRGEYVRTTINDPIASFPGPSATLEAAFPDRFIRDSSGQLVSVDLRPVNYESARRETFRWGFDFSKPLKSKAPSREQIERLRALRGGMARRAQPGDAENPTAPPAGASGPDGPNQAGSPPDESAGGPPPREAGRGGGRGGGFGGFGGRSRGRLQLSVTDTINLVDTVQIGPGIPELDFLSGDAVGRGGGRPRHEVEAQGGWSNNGIGARVSANWRSGTDVESATGDDLHFSPLATVDLRLFANLGEQFGLVSKHPWLRGSSVRFEVSNLFNSRPKVTDAFGDTPSGLQRDLLDPLGRTVSISFRKLFLPTRFGGGGRNRPSQR